MTQQKATLIALFATLLIIGAGAVTMAQEPDRPPANAPLAGLGSGFTYQGELTDSDGNPLEGTCGFRFRLYDGSGSGATQIGSEHVVVAPVVNGRFTAVVNDGGEFGSGAFDGNPRWLEVAVQCGGDSGFTTLGRQALTATPYALALPGLWTQQNNTSPNLIGGFTGNLVAGGVVGAVVGGGGQSGATNSIFDNFGTIGGGSDNSAGTDNDDPTDAPNTTIGGGTGNQVVRQGSTVGGGETNTAFNSYSTVSGGLTNHAGGNRATVGGGESNLAQGFRAVIGGGYDNDIGSGAQNATIAGGRVNEITNDGDDGTIGGGHANTVSGVSGTIPGGENNVAAGSYSMAAGRRAKANHNGAFVWADSTDADFSSTGSDQFLVRANGGVGIGTNNPVTQLHVVDLLSGSDPAHHVVLIENKTGGSQADLLALKMPEAPPIEDNNNFITFFDADDASVGSIEGNGSSVVLSGAGSDYAEWLPRLRSEETIESGDIVGLFADRVSKETAGADAAMVVSSEPIVAGNDPGEAQRDAFERVAFIGQAPVRVRGGATAGDYVIPSGRNDGTGTAVAPRELTTEQVDLVVGRALEGAEGAGVTKVNTLVGLPQQEILKTMLQQRDARLAKLEGQFNELEQRMEALERSQQSPESASPLTKLPASGWLLALTLVGGYALHQRRTE